MPDAASTQLAACSWRRLTQDSKRSSIHSGLRTRADRILGGSWAREAGSGPGAARVVLISGCRRARRIQEIERLLGQAQQVSEQPAEAESEQAEREAEERRRDDRSTPVTPRGPTPRPGHVPRPTAAARSDRMPGMGADVLVLVFPFHPRTAVYKHAGAVVAVSRL